MIHPHFTTGLPCNCGFTKHRQHEIWGSLVEPLEPHLTTYHGTTNRAIDLARQKGGLYSWSPRDVANEVAGHYGLDPEELYQHGNFSFSRGFREGENIIYTHTDPKVAQAYAKAGSEQLEDGLRTADRMINPEMYNQAQVEGFAGTGDGGVSMKQHQQEFAADYHAAHDIQPRVVKLQVPYSAVPQGQQKQLNYDGGNYGTYTLPAPVPLDWMSTMDPQIQSKTAVPEDEAWHQPEEEEDETSTEPSEVNNPDDHIPEWGEASPDQEWHELQWGNDGRGLGPD
jgi:hypothetical protein